MPSVGNHRIYDKYKGTELRRAVMLLKQSRETAMSVIRRHPDKPIRKLAQ
ncbi:MAG: hypothetical protein ACOC2N_03285 [Spirochaetota bacterium]